MVQFNENVLALPFRELYRRVKAGAVICKQVSGGRDQGGFVWFLQPGGSPVRQNIAEGMVKLGLVVPNNDGLFEGDSQTYRDAAKPNWRNG